MSVGRGRKGFPSIKTPGLEWVFVDRNQAHDMEQLRKKYGYHASDLNEVLPPLQRPKVVARDGYLFLILHYPVYDAETQDVFTTEVDFFMTENRLVVVNVDGYAPLQDLFRRCARSGDPHACMQGDATHLLQALLASMTAQVFSMLVRIDNDLDAIEGRLFAEHERDLIQSVLRMKTNIVEIRKAMQPHRTVIEHLTRLAPRYFPIHHLRESFDDLEHDLREIWETLAVQKETIDALHETHRSFIDFRINQIIKTLTIFSVILYPLTLLASVFGMNVSLPFAGHPQGFWIIIILMSLGTTGMLVFFKYRRWI